MQKTRAIILLWVSAALAPVSRISLTGIPPEALQYIVNGKPALEWVMERYAVTTDKDSGIVNDPNDWAAEHGDPEYIYNLVKRVVRVSVETVRIVNSLPALDVFPAEAKAPVATSQLV